MATKPNTLAEDDEGADDVIIKEAPPEPDVPVEGVKHEEDKRIKTSEDEEDDEADDKTDPEREAIRERRRLEKIERKQRRDTAISRDKLELEFLRKRNDDLERRITGVEVHAQQSSMANVDRQIKDALNEVDMAEKVIAKAVEAGNGADVTQAMRYRDQAMAKAHQLNNAKQAQRNAPAPVEPIDSMTQHYANEFLKEHKWYDVQGRDEDSAVMLAIDQGMVRDGYNPQTEEYWTELRKRGARRLPDHFGDTQDKPERVARGGPAVGGGKEHAPASTRKEVYISAERKQALVEAGVWDDPVLRQKYVKRYMEYDKSNRA